MNKETQHWSDRTHRDHPYKLITKPFNQSVPRNDLSLHQFLLLCVFRIVLHQFTMLFCLMLNICALGNVLNLTARFWKLILSMYNWLLMVNIASNLLRFHGQHKSVVSNIVWPIQKHNMTSAQYTFWLWWKFLEERSLKVGSAYVCRTYSLKNGTANLVFCK